MQTFGISHFTARGEISPIIDCYFHNEDKPRFSLYVDDCGLIEEIIVKREDFMTFREAWMQTENRVEIVGEAGLNGQIIYRFVKLTK